MRVRRAAIAAAIAVAAVATAVVLAWPADAPPGSRTGADPPAAPLPVAPLTLAEPTPDCASPGRFVPDHATVAGVTRGTDVIAVPRVGPLVAGTPPLSAKQSFGWDAGSRRAGARAGTVGLTAHTWPDGSALGNALLRSLEVGDRVVLRGGSGKVACYDVHDKVEVPPTDRRTVGRVYATHGKPQVAIVVCSGERLGPGQWTMRTVWFARLAEVGAR